MKISIGTNYFKMGDREKIASNFLGNMHSSYRNVNFFAFQRNINDEIPEFFTRRILTRDSRDFVYGGAKNAVCVKDILDGLAETDCKYFVFVNSDILLGKNFIEYILRDCWTAYGCSRVDIHPINSIGDPLVFLRYEIAGFDAFVFEREWYISKRDLFKDYLMGSIWFDTALTTLAKIAGNNDPFINKFPPQLAHVFHGWGSGAESPENNYNIKLYDSEPDVVRRSWAEYYHGHLIHRTPTMIHDELLLDEQMIETNHFNNFLGYDG